MMKRTRFGAMAVAMAVATLVGGSVAMAGNGSPPFQRTEQREACVNNQPLRQPFFGELHLHTQYSTDAATLDTRNTPRDAYLFAKGAKVGLPPFINSLAGTDPPPPPPSPPPVSSHPYCFPGEKCQFMATRTIQLPPGRALDFAAITDHSEFFGEGNICFYEEQVACPPATCGTGQVCSPLEGRCVPVGHDSAECILARQAIAGLRGGLGLELFSIYVNGENPRRFPFCGPTGDNCLSQAGNIWQQIQADAEEAYDRTSACTFTSFVAYEYTAQPSMGQCSTGNGGGSHAPCWDTADCHTAGETCNLPVPGGDNLHRNIIFRNANVPPLPVSTIEAPPGCGVGASCDNSAARGPLASPKLLLETLTSQCVDNGSTSRCQFLSIPHNPNLSGGAMFLMPESLDEAQLRHDKEPLVELMQIKGQSECRFSPKHPGAWNTADEHCDFENMSFGRLGGEFLPDPDASSVLPNSYVRNTLKNGLQFQQQTGINPFQLGFVGALDNHNGTPGATDGDQYAKTGAHGDLSYAVSGQILNQTFLLGLETNGGGLTGVWAEENSRDSLFAALQRRETFATSGTRPVVRFFGGFALPGDMCRKGDFAQKGYDNGVPMGGTLTGPTSTPPIFAVLATMDPGWPGHRGTKLQQAQIIKGWVDASGQTHEQVYAVAGQPSNGASVNLRTCETRGAGSQDLCALWTDPDFDPSEHAFYYARVLENPSCRWNQFFCNARNVDCSKPLGTCSTGGGCNSDGDCRQGEQCNPPASYTEFEYQQCCNSPVPKTVQQRAWSSPIWYTPPPQ